MRNVSLLLIALLAACEALPRDTEGSLDRARAAAPLEIGYTVAEPWVRSGAAAPSGLEADLVRAWARGEGVALRWRQASQSQLVESLHTGRIALAIGGFVQSHPYGAQIGTTQPYLKPERLVIATQPAEHRLTLSLDRFLHAHGEAIERRAAAERIK